jgi:hypothetical protein
MIKIQIDGLKEIEKQLENAIKVAPKEYKKLKGRVKDKAFENIAKHVPADEGRLRASFERKTFNGKNEWIDDDETNKKSSFQIGSHVWYGHMIDKGHITVDGKGFVKGVNFMEKGSEETNKDIKKMAEEMVEKVMGGFE